MGVSTVWDNPQVSFHLPGTRWSATSWNFSSLISMCQPVSMPSITLICGSWLMTTTSTSLWNLSTTSAPRNWRWAAVLTPQPVAAGCLRLQYFLFALQQADCTLILKMQAPQIEAQLLFQWELFSNWVFISFFRPFQDYVRTSTRTWVEQRLDDPSVPTTW